MAEKITNKKTTITLDNTVEEVLELDSNGVELYFDDEKFLDLGFEWKNLSRDNLVRYTVAKEAWRTVEEHKDAQPTPTLSIKPRLALAGKRLELSGMDPKMHYCWKRPDELQSCINDGYVHCREGENGLRSFAGEEGKIIANGKAGFEEQYLMMIPKEQYDAILKAVGDRSRQLDGAVESTAESKLAAAKGEPFKVRGTEKDGRNWGALQPVSPET